MADTDLDKLIADIEELYQTLDSHAEMLGLDRTPNAIRDCGIAPACRRAMGVLSIGAAMPAVRDWPRQGASGEGEV